MLQNILTCFDSTFSLSVYAEVVTSGWESVKASSSKNKDNKMYSLWMFHKDSLFIILSFSCLKLTILNYLVLPFFKQYIDEPFLLLFIKSLYTCWCIFAIYHLIGQALGISNCPCIQQVYMWHWLNIYICRWIIVESDPIYNYMDGLFYYNWKNEMYFNYNCTFPYCFHFNNNDFPSFRLRGLVYEKMMLNNNFIQ